MVIAHREAAADLLKRLRASAGLTQEELAERSGVSVRAISDIERGLRKSVYTDTARRLAGALAATPAERTSVEDALRGRAGGEARRQHAPLPRPPTPILGRAGEISHILTALGGRDVRLLTLTGPGGIGKTRLALEAADRLTQAFADGVVFVPLGDVHDPALVAGAIAKALGVAEAGGPLEELLVRELSHGNTLVVLDTFEHLLDAALLVSALLQRCAGVRFLVTSRRPLHIRGETELPVPPLPIPEQLGEDALATLERSPATQLFVERARAVAPHLRLDGRLASVVVEICRKVNGLPLAIELAAARVKHVPLDALAEQLERRLDVLMGGPADLPARQRTLRETIAWSHDLLGEDARALFRRLSVFSGGWDIAAAREVCGGGAPAGVSGAHVLGDLATLVDHSLITLSIDAAAPRYDMLDVIHEFASERLAEARELEATADRHTGYFLRLAEEAEPQLVRQDQETWVRRLDVERANLRGAIARTLASGAVVPSLRFTVALWRYWRHTGELAEGRRWSEAALALDGAAPDPLRAKALWGTAFIAFPQGDYERMATLAAEDLAVAQRSDDPMDLRNALTIAGQVAMCQGRFADALDPLRESLAITRRLGLSWQLGTSHLNLGNALLHSGAADEAERTFADGLATFEELGDKTFAARAKVDLAQVALLRGDTATADRLAREALVTFATRTERLGVASALDALAGVAAARGDAERSARLVGACARIQETIASRPSPFERSITRTLIEAARDRCGPSRWEAAIEEGRELDTDSAVRSALD